jgi:hypothetical protein
MSKPELKLDWCSHAAAKYACEKWHYARCVPHQKTVKLGVWEDTLFVGAVLFGTGANGNLFAPYGLRDVEGCELVRVALSAAHRSPVSRVVSVALRMLPTACPRVRLVVSFADPERGHVGGIYQAGNWLYAGTTVPADEYVVNGRRMHGRALRMTRSTHRLKALPTQNILEWVRRAIDPEARCVSGSSKHRYLFPLDPDTRARIAPLARPYPKRAAGAGGGTPPDHGGGGGSTPTAALSTRGDAP